MRFPSSLHEKRMGWKFPSLNHVCTGKLLFQLWVVKECSDMVQLKYRNGIVLDL